MKETKDEINLMATYNEVYWRGQRSREVTFKNKKSILLILWKSGEKIWEHMVVASFGDVNEALLSFYIRKKFEVFSSTNMEKNVKTFVLGETLSSGLLAEHSGIFAVDNISGLLEGDFSLDNTEYSAKSKGASGLGYKQIIEVAKSLAGLQPEQLKKAILQKKEELRKNATARNTAATDTLDKYLENKLIKAIGQSH